MAGGADHYAILGVAPTSDEVVIRAAYKALMLKYHPDTNASRNANARAAAINAAFYVLGEPARRAAYDASRSFRSASPPPPSPPSPPPHPQHDAAPTPVGANTRSVLLSRVVSVAVFVALSATVRLALHHAPGPAVITSDNSLVADMNATEGMDTLSDNMTAADPPSAFTGGMMDNGIENAASLSNVLNTSGSQTPGPATPIDFRVIENAAQIFERVQSKGGMLAARAYSEDCHKRFETNPSWTGADSCAAFDYAAHFLDAGFAKATGGRTIGYFDFEADNQADQYARLGALPLAVEERLSRIRRATEPATYEAMEAGIKRNEAKNSNRITPADVGQPSSDLGNQ